jgi:tetratricopeptide (TPR) repeat protein
MGYLLNARGDYPKALEQCGTALEINPDFWSAYSTCLGYAYDQTANHGEALKAYEKGVAIEPGPAPISLVAAEYARLGNRAKALKLIEDLNHLPAQTYVAPCNPALAYVGLGENRTAMDLLEKAYQERSDCVTLLGKKNRDWDPLRSDPRFIDLLKKVGLDK